MPVTSQQQTQERRPKTRRTETTYTRIGQDGIHQKGRTKFRVQRPRLHVPQKQLSIDPVIERMNPRKPQRNQMRYKLVIRGDSRPRGRRHTEQGLYESPLRVENTPPRPRPHWLKPLYLIAYFDELRCLLQLGLQLRIYVELDFGQGGVAADEVEELNGAPSAALAEDADELNQELLLLFELVDLAL
jgi:hypothetical protein